MFLACLVLGVVGARPARAAANQPPVANAGPDRTIAVNTIITFNGSGSRDPDGSIVAYWWRFGDGNTATTTGPQASWLYSTPGTYVLELWVRDNLNTWSTTGDTALVIVGGAATTTTTTTRPTTSSTSTTRPTTTTTRATTTSTSTSRPTTSSTSTTHPVTSTTLAGQWARDMGGSDVEVGDAVATDGTGGRFAGGSFRGTARFGNTSLTSAGAADAFLAKYDGAGNVLWAKRYGGTMDDIFTALATDANGNVFAVGRFQGQASFGGAALASSGNADIVVAKYSGSTGAHLWSKRFGDASLQSAEAVAVDPSGNVLVTGYFAGSVDFTTAVLRTPYVGDYDMFVAKLDGATGATVWAKDYPNTGNEYGFGIACDGAGNVAVTGNFNNTINFGTGDLVSPPFPDAFLLKLSPAGATLWAKDFGGADGGDSGQAVAMDAAGNIVVVLDSNSLLNLGGGTLSLLGGTDVVIGKFTGAGASVWSRRIGSSQNDDVTDVKIDGAGNVLVTGTFRWTAAFGGASVDAVGSDDGFVAKYTPTGGLVWAKDLGGWDSDNANAVAVGPAGDVYVVGTFNGTGTFAGTTLTSAGYGDAFLAHFLP
jgi:hypothetical protein